MSAKTYKLHIENSFEGILFNKGRFVIPILSVLLCLFNKVNIIESLLWGGIIPFIIMTYFYYSSYKCWETNGYKYLIIDTNNKYLVFDNELKIMFNNIEYIKFKELERPNLTLGNIKYDFAHVNIRLEIKLKNNNSITATVQYRSIAFGIFNLLRRSDINIEDNTSLFKVFIY